tara:strand:+ start:238 stop:603 length:366 start_codon:yes stop_codon:yes gene_type:complete
MKEPEIEGELKFTKKLTEEQLSRLSSVISGDVMNHPEWPRNNGCYLDFMLNESSDGLIWNGSPRTFSMHNAIKTIKAHMKNICPEVFLEGTITSKGRTKYDNWKIIVKKDYSVKKTVEENK